MPNIIFLPDLKQVEVEEGENLIAAAAKAGVLIDASCNGGGSCGVCKVKVAGAQDIPFSEHELDHLSFDEREQGYRLACQLDVTCDLEVTIPATHSGSGRKKKMVKLPEGFEFGERIRAVNLRVPKAKMTYQVNDLDRIREALDMPQMKVAPGLVCTLHYMLEMQGGQVSLVFSGDTLIGARPGMDVPVYGIAFDIGTTTVVGMLWDLETGALVDVETRTNYQSLYGADVITRISYSMSGGDKLEVLKAKVLQCCNEILDEICERSSIDSRQIFEATMDGNTTMTHLALGVTPRSLSRTPFAPVFCEAQNVTAEWLGLDINPLANVHFLPVIAGHVGGDIVGMMIAAGVDALQGSHIAIDIGTNGEVVAVKDGKMMCCSTAAGPAFEGASIRFGMRAAPGAIEKVAITDAGVAIGTIEDAEPEGICGSGLIDAVAQLLEAGIVDDYGKLITAVAAKEVGISDVLVSRIIGTGNDACFLLAERHGKDDIVLTQNDIREVQLAKGAILAGIQTLMKELDMSVEEIDSIMLAGAFGNYIDKDSALRIGLFPQVDRDKVIPIGNAAGVGCCMSLLSAEERVHAAEVARATTHIELSKNADFQDFYIMAMTFKLA